jgi:hypothetical protein
MAGSGGLEPIEDKNVNNDDDWIPGEMGYIENTKHARKPVDGQEGENIIYVGSGIYWGHSPDPKPYKTRSEWLGIVKRWNGGAEIQKRRHRPGIGLINN